ncbi:MAG: hypothetical protein US30_C0017G0010 [Candidatus Moranbacteria bacterium GW2011_GWF2_36_839]|nr:MAG: hypothetical protein US27_C0018G0010 [Candidatus Moranbacteria bacterium GW2011_GWF1_36_78]KKQ16466.1 MAG: hypothetical protein US30_C0017G0010 [Candidatus Moranbacteria bacterium GW2011_GWF2_36_839]HAT74161.1 hypothetical protein [Candidatus Moranbacteria bacterium]HBY11214.1 hypothetical protein [Candidatus Moranbacteria bacterium]
MKNHNQDNLEKAFTLLESGVKLEKVLMMFPLEKEEIKEIYILINSIQKAQEKIHAPKEILKKIFKENGLANQKAGRLSVFETLNNLINNLITMNQKSKIIIPVFGIFVFLIVGIIIFNSNKNTPEKIANKQEASVVNETQNVTATAVIGDKEIDASINSAINEVLSDNDLESEFADIELALSDESELDQINNLFNENEL